MKQTIVIESTELVKEWLMHLDSITPFDYSEDLAIRLYNVTTEDDYGAWDDWMTEMSIDPKTGRGRLVPYLESDDLMEGFTNAMSNILIAPIDSYFEDLGLEVVCIKDSKVIRTLNNGFTVYSTIEVKSSIPTSGVDDS